ncbi:MAG: hypothetical protein GY760_08025 [Deltaproteobacteria bacterium]|nr:hypothetical protein [Deltaproteobacteria bacterium]
MYLIPEIGYDKATEIAKKAFEKDKTIQSGSIRIKFLLRID